MDRRYRKVETSIKHAFIYIAKHTDFLDISVKEVCVKADINRSTFYLHYQNLSEVLYSLEDDIIAQLMLIIAKPYNDFKEFIISISELVYQNKELLKIIFSSSETHFARKIEQIILPFFKASPFNTSSLNEQSYNYVLSFTIDGSLGVFRKWIDDDCKLDKNVLINDFFTYIKDQKLLLNNMKGEKYE